MNNPALVNIFILLFGALQASLLIMMLLKKKAYRSGYVFLVAYLLVMMVQVLLKAMSKGWLMQEMETVYFLSYQLPFLYGPLAWLCCRRLLQQRVNKKKDLLHLIPFLVFAIDTILHLNVPVAFHIIPGIDVHSRWILQLASVVVYHGLALKAWYKLRVKAKQYFSSHERNRFEWLSQFIYISFAVCCIITTAIYLMYIYYPLWTDARFGFVALTAFIYWVSYKAWSEPELFTVYHGSAEANTTVMPKLVVHYPSKKYANSTLQREEAERIQKQVEELLQKKIYLDAELTIDKLSGKVGCSRHHLSQVLNEQMGMSFYDCINAYRIKEAKTLLLDPGKLNQKIAALAYDAGFNSLSTFNEVFKKLTGVTPSQYRKESEERLVAKRS